MKHEVMPTPNGLRGVVKPETMEEYHYLFASKYPPEWPAFEHQLKELRGMRCQFCGWQASVTSQLQAHHIIPVHTPEGEARVLDPTNVIIVCPWDHLHEGHVGDYMDWDVDVLLRAAANLAAINAARAATGVTPDEQAPL